MTADKYDYVVYDIDAFLPYKFRNKIGSRAITPEDDELMNSLRLKLKKLEADRRSREEAQTIMATRGHDRGKR